MLYEGSLTSSASYYPCCPECNSMPDLLALRRAVVPSGTGESRYDPVPGLLRASPSPPTGDQKFDLFGWLRRSALQGDSVSSTGLHPVQSHIRICPAPGADLCHPALPCTPKSQPCRNVCG